MTDESPQTIWRHSASLIIAAPSKIDQQNKDAHDYKLLLLKRSEATSVAPNHAVFPGGLFDEGDESVEWLKYFEEFGIGQDQLRQFIISSDQRPQVLAPQGNGCYDRFFKKSRIWSREISLRLTAIRETFEEAGILLCLSRDQLKSRTTGEKRNYVHVWHDYDKEYWQRVVHDDPNQFLQMCRTLCIVPDLWALYEWSAWASPAIMRKGYETVFFITFVECIPEVLIERVEVKEYLWQDPPTLWKLFRSGEVWFLPPQVYETSRFMSVKSFKDLVEYARKRNARGCALYLPIAYICSDGLVSILPGDDCYENDPRAVTALRHVDTSVKEFRSIARRLHRCENVGSRNATVQLNFVPSDGHPIPASFSETISKL